MVLNQSRKKNEKVILSIINNYSQNIFLQYNFTFKLEGIYNKEFNLYLKGVQK